MIQLAQTAHKQPRISANQLGEFVFASETKQIRILQDQKFGNLSAAPYYGPALAGIRRSFKSNGFSASALLHEAQVLAHRDAEKPQKAKMWANNALAVESFAEICDESNPPAGDHRMLRKNAQINLDDVTISVYPEIVTENLGQGFIAFTKLRFSKSKISMDVSEIVLLILQYYGQRLSRPGLEFNFSLSKVIDCFSKTVISGHAIRRHRDQQLHQALKLIRWLWPRIEPKD